jgi:hypothetical protein
VRAVPLSDLEADPGRRRHLNLLFLAPLPFYRTVVIVIGKGVPRGTFTSTAHGR